MSIEIKPGFYYENGAPVVNTDTAPLKIECDEHVPIIVAANANLRLAMTNLMMGAFMDGAFPEYDDAPNAIGYNADDVIDVKTGCKPKPSHHQNYLKLRKGY